MVKCQVIMDAMEKIAPHNLAEKWDNPGLLLGNPAQKVNKLMVCLDVNEKVINQAVSEHCDMIISHHPFIFQPIKKIRTDHAQGKMIQTLLHYNIAVFAAHTNLDSAHGGVNDTLCTLWGITNTAPLDISYKEELVKLCVFVPRDYADQVRMAIGDAGAGATGNYSHCSFESDGIGHFLPLDDSTPFIGKIGEISSVNEIKLETIFPAKLQGPIIKAMLKNHPYEEPAYEIFPLNITGDNNGLGRIGELAEPMELEEFSLMIKNTLPATSIRLVKSNDKTIKKVALCSGAGSEFIGRAKILGADIYITGDVKYHEAQKAQELNINLIDAGHFGTEFPVVKTLNDKLATLANEKKWNIDIIYDNCSIDPFITI